MPDNGLQAVKSDKRSGPIVQVAGTGVDRSVATRRVRRSGSRRQVRIALFVVLIVSGVVAGGYFALAPRDRIPTIFDYSAATVSVTTLQETVEISGLVAARREATVTAPESGTMGALLVSEGDWIAAGELVAVLETKDLVDQLESQQLAFERQQRDLDRFLLQHQYDLRAFDRRRENLADDLTDAVDELEDTRELHDLGSASTAELEKAEDLVESARDAVEDHDAEVEEAVAVHELSRSNYEDDLDASRRSIAELEERIENARVISPMTGRVIQIEDAGTNTGDRIQQYQTLMEIADARNPLIETEIEEQYVPLLEAGRPVAVTISDRRVAGYVERVGLVAQSGADGGTPTVELDVAVDVGDAEITIGTSTIVEILVGEVADAVVLPRGPYLTSGNRQYLYRIDGDRAHRIPVAYGTITDDSVQIVSGVQPGDLIITSSYSSYIDSETVHLGGNE